MRFFKNLIRICILVCSLVLTSCGLLDLSGEEYNEPIVLGEYAGQRITLGMVNKASDILNLSSTGEQNILVIPVCFSDFTLTTLNMNNSTVKKNLTKAFFGESEETGWESVSSYYAKSSYNKLSLHGKVSDVITLSYKLSDVVNHEVEEEYYDQSYLVLEEACEKYKQSNDDILDFDNDGDGYIDGVWIIYLNPCVNEKSINWYRQHDRNFIYDEYILKANDLLWAYTYWDFHTKANTLSPNPFTYCFGSYGFLWEKEYRASNLSLLVDSHTYIHETGHMLGLDDYYCYDQREHIYSPSGSIDMMDNNVGDHNSYSKYLLNWVSPKIVKAEGRYTITKFQDQGDCLLIPVSETKFNDSPFDEYLLVELYTPDGLNYSDSISAYTNKIILPNQVGVKVYHVDSRLGLYKYDIFSGKYRFSNFTNNYYNSNEKYVKIAASNTPSYSQHGNPVLSLLSASNNGSRNYVYANRENGNALNIDLFTESSIIKNFLFNNASYSPYTITFENLTSSSVDIVITNT